MQEKRTHPPGVVSFFDYAAEYIKIAGYEHDIEWAQKVRWENHTADSFFGEYVWVVLCAAFREQIARKVEREFWDAVHSGNPDPCSVIKHPGKRKAIASMSFVYKEKFEELKKAKDKYAYIRTLPYMGDALSAQLYRNMGFDVPKPDVWMERLINYWKFKTPMDLCKEIQTWRPEFRIGTIDVILWRYCNLTGMVY